MAAAPPSAPRFGIAEAVALVQSLPNDVDGTATLVIRRTLEAVGISIADLMVDGDRVSVRIEREMQHLVAEVDQLEQRVTEKRARLEQLQSELHAVNGVRARFEEASMQDVALEATVSHRG